MTWHGSNPKVGRWLGCHLKPLGIAARTQKHLHCDVPWGIGGTKNPNLSTDNASTARRWTVKLAYTTESDEIYVFATNHGVRMSSKTTCYRGQNATKSLVTEFFKHFGNLLEASDATTGRRNALWIVRVT